MAPPNDDPEVTAAMEAKGYKLVLDRKGDCHVRTWPGCDCVEYITDLEGRLPTSFDQRAMLRRPYRDGRAVGVLHAFLDSDA
jgi:hypothetical protein